MRSRAEICSGLHAVAHRRPARRALLRPFHGAVAGPVTAVRWGRRTLPARRSCTYSRSRGSAASLAVLGRRATSSAFHCATDRRYSSLPPPRRPVLQLAASRRRVASQLARDRRRRAAELTRDRAHALAFGTKQGDLLTLGKAQVPARLGVAQQRGHPATLTKPPDASGRRHPDRGGRILAAQALGDLTPEPQLSLAPMRRLARRLHRRTPRQLLHPTSRPAHRHLVSSRCCDDHVNPPSSSVSRSGSPTPTPPSSTTCQMTLEFPLFRGHLIAGPSGPAVRIGVHAF